MHYHYGSSCHCDEPPPKGSKAVSLLLRLSTLVLAITSAVVMASSCDCTAAIAGDLPRNGCGIATATVPSYSHYAAFVYLVVFNITSAVLQAVAIYLQFRLGGVSGDEEEEGSKLPRIILVVVDVLVPALLHSATGAAYATASAYSAQIGGCTQFGVQVKLSKILSLAASAAVAAAVIAKDVPLPFNVPP